MKRGLVIVSLGFLLTNIVYYLLGIRFLGMPHLGYYLQFIDPPLLQHDLLASLYYSSFPPLYNLIVGVTLKIFGESALAFAGLNFFIGWVLALVLFSLMVDLGVGKIPAAVATLGFLALPPAILYENWLFYTYLETLLFTTAVWGFSRCARRMEIKWGVLLLSRATALALLNARMMFYVVLAALGLWWVWRKQGRPRGFAKTAAWSATPVLLLLAVMAKNAWLFGAFTVDPHFGFHMGNGFIFAVRGDTETYTICKSDYPLLTIPPTELPPPEKIGLAVPPPTGIPLLDDLKRSSGHPNFQSLYYLEVSRQYQSQLAGFITQHPRLYLRFVGKALANYWLASDRYDLFPQDNREVLGEFEVDYDFAYPLLLSLYLAGMAYTVFAGWPTRWASPASAALGFALISVLYSMLAIFVTLGENDRYKFTVEPLLLVMTMCALQKALPWFRRPPASTSSPTA